MSGERRTSAKVETGLSTAGSTVTARLRLMATSDLHMQILPYDYCRDRSVCQPGLSHLVHLIEQMRRSCPNTLLFDVGDFLQGTPMADYLASLDGLAQGMQHPIISAMNELQYDAVTLGNHEFNYGIEFLQRVLSDAQFPVVTSNILLAGGCPKQGNAAAAHLGIPSLMIERALQTSDGGRRRIRLGVIGLAPPQLTEWDRHLLAGRVVTRDIVEAAAETSARLRAEGADLVIALAHTGIGSDRHSPGMENAALPLARQGGADLLLLGHSHKVFPRPGFEGIPGVDTCRGRLYGRPAVSPGHSGSHLGVIDVTVRTDGTGWTLDSAKVCAQRVPRLATPNRRMQTAVATAHVATRAHLARRIGWLEQPLNSYFAQVAESSALQLIGIAKRHWLRQRIAGTSIAGLPIVAAVNAHRCGGHGGPENFTDLPAGPLCVRHLYDLYSYPNSVAVLRLSGLGLRAWLEHAARHYTQVPPGAQDLPLLRADTPAYLIDQIYGLSYVIDLTLPAAPATEGHIATGTGTEAGAGGRVTDVWLDGQRLAPENEVLLVTNSFRAAGGGHYPGASRANIAFDDHTPLREIIGAFLTARTYRACPVTASSQWQLRLPKGSSVWFDTGPGALHHLGTIAHLNPEPLGETTEGFLRLRLRG